VVELLWRRPRQLETVATFYFIVQVYAEHEEKKESGDSRRRMFVRQYRLPKGVDAEQIRPTLSKDGVLTVEAPAPGLTPTERLIPIQYKAE
jgi:HSP20 family molecular chaperone IbpA